ncbi:MAG: hypothetical protein OXU42_11700, partial [Deltaproteobacteria bacterium]|nr:hypothetical protein [Deltaproteobacteria bacterium]
RGHLCFVKRGHFGFGLTRASHRGNVLSCINSIPSSSLHVNAVAAAKIKTVHEMVDYVTCFANAERCGIIHDLAPDVLVKGGDWRREDIVGREVVEANGGEVVIVPRLPRYSSTELIERIREQ